MPSEKFAKIIRKVSEHVAPSCERKADFEVSDGVVPMALYWALTPHVQDGVVRVELSARPSSCKPRDRWLGRSSSHGLVVLRPGVILLRMIYLGRGSMAARPFTSKR
ncbi:hypothetical protein ELH93_19635 [Rhizobium leguminosarum]|uniref:hypothetical protein n=1 Tax=Rhizobium leguminosarum TaxID=384 RepID=UPI001030EC93|nr:hypothetical protein ELH93_19635 [Rhizobium leguminosarum]